MKKEKLIIFGVAGAAAIGLFLFSGRNANASEAPSLSENGVGGGDGSGSVFSSLLAKSLSAVDTISGDSNAIATSAPIKSTPGTAPPPKLQDVMKDKQPVMASQPRTSFGSSRANIKLR